MGLLDIVKKEQKFSMDPLGIKDKMKPSRPEKTAEQLAAEKRLQMSLDKETEEEERRLKAASRASQGRQSLLGGQKKKRRNSGPSFTGRGNTTSGSTSGSGTTSAGTGSTSTRRQ